jgi:mRNA interferase ChpB
MGRCPGGGPRDTVKRGDVYMVDLDPTQGREQRGRRPVLIVSPEAFNLATRLPVIVPLEGTKTTGIVRCDQPRVLDLDARKGRKTESLPAAIIEEVLAKVVTIFGGV